MKRSFHPNEAASLGLVPSTFASHDEDSSIAESANSSDIINNEELLIYDVINNTKPSFLKIPIFHALPRNRFCESERMRKRMNGHAFKRSMLRRYL